MKKADIEKRSPNPNGYFGEWAPAINVKWYPYLPEIIRKFKGTTDTSPMLCKTCDRPNGPRHPDHPFIPGGAYPAHEYGDDELFWAWVERIDSDRQDGGWEYPNGQFYRAEEIAREDGWERAQEDAETVWENTRYSPKVESDGRSGGWLVVRGLPDIDEWDAIAVGRWARYVKWVKATLDDLDYQFIWHLHVNVYENEPDYNPDAGFQLTLEDA